MKGEDYKLRTGKYVDKMLKEVPASYRKPHESSIQHHNTLYKKLNREYLIDQLVN